MSRGPVPVYSNPRITPWYYAPSKFDIADITRGRTTIVTMTPSTTGGTTVNPNYVVGQRVRINMTFGYGMPQINTKEAYVLSVPSSTTVELDIDSRFFNAFDTSPTGATTPSQIVAIGDINSGQINSSGRTNQLSYIPGSFRDIS
jgi:hypothetical protein